jgi:TetR/AcrR family transcriptional regulator of autoinduction and epiphytic fitness
MDAAIALKQVTYDARTSLSKQLSRFVDAKLAFANNPQWMGMMRVTAGVFRRYPELTQEIIQRSQAKEDTLVSWLEAATDDGALKVSEPEVAAAVFWSIVTGALFWPAIFYGPLPVDEVQRLKTEMIEMFLQPYLPD